MKEDEIVNREETKGTSRLKCKCDTIDGSIQTSICAYVWTHVRVYDMYMQVYTYVWLWVGYKYEYAYVCVHIGSETYLHRNH